MEYGCLIIKSDPSRPFKLYLDSALVNSAPKNCIRAEHLEKYSYNIMIVFQDSSLNQIVKPKLFICNKKGIKREFTYELIQDSGMMKLNFVSMLPVQPRYPASDSVFVFDAIGKNIDQNSMSVPSEKKINIVSDPVGIKANNSSQSGLKRKKTQIDSASVSVMPKKQEDSISLQVRKLIEAKKQDGVVNSLVLMEPVGWHCGKFWPVPQEVYERGIDKIKKGLSTEERMRLAKKFAEDNCLKTVQVIDICLLFSTDQERLEFAKFAYRHTIDIKNYLQVNSVFTAEGIQSDFIYFISH